MTKAIHGYTLIEILLTITISAVLLGLGLPSFSSLLSSNRLASQVNNMSSTLALARSESVTRNHYVVICKSANQQSCTRTTSWNQGWLVYVDKNRDRKKNKDEPVLHVQQGFKNSTQLDYRAFGSRHYIVYRPTGETRTNGTFTFCDPKNPDLKRALILMKTGRVRFSRNKSNGEELECS